MPFIDKIQHYKSVSIVGLEKNTGKTECLNYILRRLENSGRRLALTSIGVDGERVDQVSHTAKPEIILNNPDIFITSEKHYRQKKLQAEILDISNRRTALGRLVTARVLSKGKIMLSGPSDTVWLKQVVKQMEYYSVDTTIVDGAISRLSHGSPAITAGIILTTGAAVSSNLSTLVSHTRFVCKLVDLPVFQPCNNGKENGELVDELLEKNTGLFAIDEHNHVHDIGIRSVFLLKDNESSLFNHGHRIYVTGALTGRMMDYIRMQSGKEPTTVIVRDFTRLFLKPATLNAFLSNGNKLEVLLKTNLLAVCVNPWSPAGYSLNSAELCSGISSVINIPVYDIKNI